MTLVEDLKSAIAGCCISDSSTTEAVKRIIDVLKRHPATIDQVNNIPDLRIFLRCHPNREMVTTSCLHFLGDDAQQWWADRERRTEAVGKRVTATIAGHTYEVPEEDMDTYQSGDATFRVIRYIRDKDGNRIDTWRSGLSKVFKDRLDNFLSGSGSFDCSPLDIDVEAFIKEQTSIIEPASPAADTADADAI